MGLITGIKGVFQGWFAPGNPMPASAQETQGRQFNTVVGANYSITPRSEELEKRVGFDELDRFSVNLPVLRVVIETLKDQIASLPWSIAANEDGSDLDIALAKDISDFMEFPDGITPWISWIRMFLEDILVLDAGVIFPQKTMDGSLHSLKIISGRTIKRLLDNTGRTPTSAGIPAYQQILNGVVASDFEFDQIMYFMRNPRPNYIYGYSPVEQIIRTIQVAIERQKARFNVYAEGNIPDVYLTAPEDWQPDQIEKMQQVLDAVLSGNTKRKSGGAIVIPGLKPVEMRPNPMKDLYDEWLVREICACFSVSPNQFVAVQNRATAETSIEQAKNEGMRPYMMFVESIINKIIKDFYKTNKIQFRFSEKQYINPLDKTNILINSVNAGIFPRERAARMILSDLGEIPLTDEEIEELKAFVPPAAPLAAAIKKADEPKKPKSIPPIDRNRDAATRAAGDIADAIERAQQDALNESVAAINDAADNPDAASIANELKMAGFDDLPNALEPIYKELLTESIAQTATQIDHKLPAPAEKVVNQNAVDWARERGVELIGKKINDNGDIVDNPNPKYKIKETTRDAIRVVIADGIENGHAPSKISKNLRESYGLSRSRADLIAHNERAAADVAGNLIYYKASGLVKGKSWLASNMGDVCPACVGNEAQGVIEYDDNFQSGDFAPPAHGGCHCDIAPSLI